ncbi:MAG: methyltransferase domain-containing protein [Flavobacteriales bacterium]|nr:methyltransferase domain-containing protein [Flavobacteriales bacterium]
MSSTNKIDWCSGWFNTDYYHLLYAHRNSDEAELFIKNLISNLRIPEGAKVLDIACGKGRHACTLFKYNLKVWGIDIAPNNIAEAKNNSHPAIIFEVFDMRNVYKKEYFDYAFNLFTSFGYFENEQENDATIKSISENLKKHGLLILDFFNTNFVKETIKEKEQIIINKVEFNITRKISKNRVVKKIQINDHGQQYLFEENVRLYTLDELTTLLKKFGLSVIKTFGDYHLNSLNETNSPRVILVAQKI